MSEIFGDNVEHKIRMIVEELRKETDNQIAKEILDVYMRNFVEDSDEEMNFDLGITYAIGLMLVKAPIRLKSTLFETLSESAIMVSLLDAMED